MTVRIRIKDRVYTLSWDEFEKLVERKTLDVPVDIVSMG
jgi:YD repeat-containing protein